MIMTAAYEAQLRHEIARCDDLIRRLEPVLIDAKAFSDHDLRDAVTTSINEALEALKDGKKEKAYQLEHPLRG